MYHETFRPENELSPAKKIFNTINHSETGLRANLTERGIDNGVWVPLKVAFTNDELVKHNIPLVQVSLTDNDLDFDIQDKLGQILSEYRSKGGILLRSRMSVHNLCDMGSAGSKHYNEEFTSVLNDILLTKEHNKLDKFKGVVD